MQRINKILSDNTWNFSKHWQYFDLLPFELKIILDRYLWRKFYVCPVKGFKTINEKSVSWPEDVQSSLTLIFDIVTSKSISIIYSLKYL